MVTAETSPVALQRAHKAGADQILHKPVTIDRIVSECQRLLNTGDHERTEAVPPDADGAAAAKNRPQSQSKSFARCTTTSPRFTPPVLLCPSCDRPLTYERSHIGGVNARAAEQWDDYSCTSCGTFQYRQRTRKLTQTN
jgi:DNA-binding response OmpR family regulator